MKRLFAVAALATLALGGCAMDGQQRAFVQGINNDTAAQPIPSEGMWRLSNGVVVPMGYAPLDLTQDQLVMNSVNAAPGVSSQSSYERSVIVR